VFRGEVLGPRSVYSVSILKKEGAFRWFESVVNGGIEGESG
jgi:hypothetical protein